MIGALSFLHGGELMATLVSIGGFDFPEPSTYNATTPTMVDSGSNIQGKVVGVVVR